MRLNALNDDIIKYFFKSISLKETRNSYFCVNSQKHRLIHVKYTVTK